MIKNFHNYLIITSLTTLFPLFSCQEDRFSNEELNEVEFSFIYPENLTSRVVITPDGSGTFKEGDKISLYAGDGPVKHYILTLRNGTWTPKLERKDLGTGLVTINACYPANEHAEPDNRSYPFSLSTNQNGEGYATSDILWVNQTINMDDLQENRIKLPFMHGLHRLCITLTAESGKLPSDLKVAVKGATNGTFSFFSGNVQASDSQMEWITPKDNGTGSFWAILIPQSLKNLQTGDGWIRITANGKDVYYKAPDKIGGLPRLEPGKESVITLRLKENGSISPNPGEDTDAEWANQKRWVFGITSPVLDPGNVIIVPFGSSHYPLGQWVSFRNQWSDGTYTDNYRLPWKEGCGWYDVSKTYAWNGVADDHLCWAASSSNILHWWLGHNAKYIEAYDQKYGNTDYYKRYPRPSAVFEPYPKMSEIFNGLFVHTFNNRGAGEGVNWFINGSSGHGTSGIIDPNMQEFKGYFKEVFTPSTNLYEYNPAMSKTNFNRIMKDALENRKAIAFATNGNHDMTIWGAEFDEHGNGGKTKCVNHHRMGKYL